MAFASTFRSATYHPARRVSPLGWLLAADALWRERRALSRMDADRLADIGATRAAATREAARPVWDAASPRWR